jgi:hypothetical protein
VFLLAVAVPPCFGQDDGTDIHIRPQVIHGSSPSGVSPQDEEIARLKANVNLPVPVTVTDQQDRLVIGLEKDNFGVYDGYERQVAEFRALLDAADYRLTRIIPTLAPQSVIEAVPNACRPT